MKERKVYCKDCKHFLGDEYEDCSHYSKYTGLIVLLDRDDYNSSGECYKFLKKGKK